MAGLATVGSEWAGSPGWAWWLAPLGLVAAAAGYLCLKCRNHDVRRTAVVRGLGATLLGLAHAVAVALIALATVLPLAARPDAFPGRGSSELWALWVAASVGLALAVFTQVLWDDRPVPVGPVHPERGTRGGTQRGHKRGRYGVSHAGTRRGLGGRRPRHPLGTKPQVDSKKPLAGPGVPWSGRRDSNPRPSPWQAVRGCRATWAGGEQRPVGQQEQLSCPRVVVGHLWAESVQNAPSRAGL